MNATGYRHYLLTVLLVIYAFNLVDRLVLGLVLQDIKVDLGLSDTQLGLLTGIAFAVFYSVMGLPLARWADRGNRVTIIALTAAVWSVMAALCGLARSFLHLLVIRIGAAVGEAGCVPPAHSLIADYFSRAERPRAMARYMLAGPLSVGIGYFLAGWLNEFYGWRATFILLGLPGLALAALAWFTLREPRRGPPPREAARGGVARGAAARGAAAPALAQPVTAAVAAAPPSLTAVGRTLWANTTFRHLLVGWSVLMFFVHGLVQWQPAFFIRSHGLATGELGTWFALNGGLGGLLGTWWGGELASRYAAQNERLQLKAMALAYTSFGLLYAFIFLAPTHYWAFGLMFPASVGVATAAGPLFATTQTLVPDRMRATSIALIYLFANLIGMGLGPLAVGALSDALRPLVGEESLRFALLALCPGFGWAGWHLWRASRTVARDLDAVHAEEDRAAREADGVATASAQAPVA